MTFSDKRLKSPEAISAGDGPTHRSMTRKAGATRLEKALCEVKWFTFCDLRFL
jgi:hypothetical protein